MKTKFILLVTGLLLLTGFFGTSKQALSERNVAIYEKALSLEDTIDTGFSCVKSASTAMCRPLW